MKKMLNLIREKQTKDLKYNYVLKYNLKIRVFKNA